MTWFMTVGNPGGEYATRGESHEAASQRLRSLLDIAYFDPLPHVRPCPPDLVEWIEHTDKPRDHWHRKRVIGGFIVYCDLNDIAVFVPVAGAAGLTVLEAGI